MSAAAFDFNIFEQYKNLERSGMAELIAHAVKEIGQDRAFDQLRHEIKEIKREIKSDINSTIENFKTDMIKWMVSLFFTQVSLTIAVIACIKIFG